MDYAELLTNAGEAGIFVCPADAEGLEAAARRAGLAHWHADLADARTGDDLMVAMQRALGLVDGCGTDLDMLNDALAERALSEPAGVMLTLAHCGEVARADGEAFEQLLEGLDAIAEHCYDEDIAFWVFVEGVAAADFDLPVLGEE